MYDFIIIGAGIIGSLTARELSRYQCRTLVLDMEADIANQTTMANSAIIHTGYDPEEGTLKARLNVKGSRMYPKLCDELGAAYKRTSAFVAATSEEEEATLYFLYQKAKKRGINAQILTGKEARVLEPNLSNEITQVLELPETAVVMPWEVAIAAAEDAVQNGVSFRLEREVTAIRKIDKGFRLTARHQGQKEVYESRYVINAAGVFADQIYAMVYPETNLRITPRSGEYYVIDKFDKPFVERVIYPVPSEKGKGVLAVPTVHGNLLLGPNARDTDQPDGINNTAEGLAYVKENIGRLIKHPPLHKVIRTYAGLRAVGNNGDFLIEESKEVPGFIQAACIDSPGLASAPAIAEYIIEEIVMQLEPLEKKSKWIHRKPPTALHTLDKSEKKELAASNPKYAHMICRCEQITEGEIMEAIHRPLGARSIKAVKKRVRPGMGRCQGGFCEPRILEILARECGLSPLAVRYDGWKSPILMEDMNKREGGRI